LRKKNVREGRKTNGEVVGEDEEEVDNAGGRDNASCLGSDQNGGRGGVDLLGAHRSGTEFGRSDGYVGGRLVFEATSFEDVLYARRVLEIRIGLLQGRDGMIST
jgi:hypothetical protein